jgi:hypothetical protein
MSTASTGPDEGLDEGLTDEPMAAASTGPDEGLTDEPMAAAGTGPDEGLTDEPMAAASTGPFQDRPGSEARPQPGAQTARPQPGAQTAWPQPGAQTAQPVQQPAPWNPGDAAPAVVGLAGQDDRSDGSPAGSFDRNDASGPAGAGAARADEGSRLAAGDGPPAHLLADDEQERIIIRWKEIQADFVDDPRKAVEQADALVSELTQRLAAMFARERAALARQWTGGTEASTEDLRQSLRHYRSFFERLLAV